MMHKRYTKEQLTAVEAQRLAQEIAFGPVVFQVSRLMLKFGIFQLLADKRKGYTLQEISVQTGLTRYAAQYYWKHRWPSEPSCWKKTAMYWPRQAGFC